jgi:ABC-type transport system involved in multi-copper enzyme maturation permease subunit
MIRSLVWKEYRELRLAWLGITGVGGVLLMVLGRWMSTGSYMAREAAGGYLVAGGLMLSWCFGVVSGAMLLAGEREDGTLSFLDTLPAYRGRLWLGKGVAALGWIVAQAAVMLPLLVVLDAITTATAAAAVLAGLVTMGLVGLAWGMFSSARHETVLRAIVRATGMQVLVAGLLGLVLVLAWALAGSPSRASVVVVPAIFLVGAAVATVAATAGSVRTFGLTDRQRRLPSRSEQQAAVIPALLWLTRRQEARFAVVVWTLSVLGGVGLFVSPITVWPLLTLLIGVVCGVRAFAGGGGSRVLVAQLRLPAGRLWLVRVTTCIGIALAACVLALVPLVVPVHGPSLLGLAAGQDNRPLLTRLFLDHLLDGLVEPEAFLPMWVLHGLAAGLVCGLIIRRAALACVSAVLVGAAAVAIWLPSLVGGGLHWWQYLGFPAGMLLASRLLVPAWASGEPRWLSRPAALAVGLVVAAAWTGAGLWYRVAEVPTVPDTLDIPGFVTSLPGVRANETGRRVREALEALERRNAFVRPDVSTRPLFADGTSPIMRERFDAQLEQVLQRGWPRGEPELVGWLQQMFDPAWTTALVQAAERPPAMVVDPRLLTARFPIQVSLGARLAGALLAVHGLWQQSMGDDTALPADLRTGLALVRNLRHRAPTFVLFSAESVETSVFGGLDRWLDRLGSSPRPLRQALSVLTHHESQPQPDFLDFVRSDALIALNGLHAPEVLLPALNRDPDIRRDVNAVGFAAVALAWLHASWELARQERLLHWLAQRDGATSVPAAFRSPMLAFSFGGDAQVMQKWDRLQTTRRRAALLTVALRLYEAEHGKSAAALDPLVPQYLAAVPTDPYDAAGRPFRYRLSQGEDFIINRNRGTSNDKQKVHVPAGRGILLSVGAGSERDDWRSVRVTPERADAGTDWIYLVDSPVE